MRKWLTQILCGVFCSLLFTAATAQQGCTDPLATNYDPDATQNDGSCAYPTTNYTLEFVANLPSSVKECSGLLMINNQLWAHNDGGNSPTLFQLDTLTGNILRRVRLAPGNWDWEDLAQSDEHLFIGDIGNNDGARQNLIIYKINQSELALDTIWNVDTLSFSFQDQIDYTPANFDTPYDCEAFFYLNDSLYIFTKDWVTSKTKYYTIPTVAGHYDVLPKDSLEVTGLITGADMASDGVISLLGYNAAESFMWLLFDYSGSAIFSGNKRKITLDNFTVLGQTEGITFSRAGEGFIGSEELFTFPAKLFKFKSSSWTNPISTAVTSIDHTLLISPNPFSDFIEIENTDFIKVDLFLFDQLGRPLKKYLLEENEKLSWDLHDLAVGYYNLVVQTKAGVTVHRLAKVK